MFKATVIFTILSLVYGLKILRNKDLKSNKYIKTNKKLKKKTNNKFKKSNKLKHKTLVPTNYQTQYITKYNDISNCMQWTCKEWCKFYDERFEKEYEGYGCIDDGNNYCIC